MAVCDCGGMQATICRALQNDLPTPKQSALIHTHKHTQYGNSQNTQVKIAANYMRLQSSKGRQAFALFFFSSHCLCPCLCFCCCCDYFRRQSATQLFSCRFFSIALTFRSVLGKCFCRLHIRDKHARCFVLLLRRPAAPQITPHPPSHRQNVNNNTIT